MGDDRTLEEFLGDRGSGTGDGAGGAPTDDGEATDDGAAREDRAHRGADVEPAAPTYRWSPDGADCEACGATVERRWRDGEGYVCGDCKEW